MTWSVHPLLCRSFCFSFGYDFFHSARSILPQLFSENLSSYSILSEFLLCTYGDEFNTMEHPSCRVRVRFCAFGV